MQHHFQWMICSQVDHAFRKTWSFLFSEEYALCWVVTRYKLKYLPEANLVIATLPGSVTADIAIPHGWPMPEFFLHLNSLLPSAKGRDLQPSGVLQQCVVIPLHPLSRITGIAILLSCTLISMTFLTWLFQYSTSRRICPVMTLV